MDLRSNGENAGLMADLLEGTDCVRLAALEQLYGLYGRDVFSFVAHSTGDAPLAEQVVEEVFVHLWCQPQSFDSAGSLRSHLLKDAYSRCMSLMLEHPADNFRNTDNRGPDGRGAGGGWEALTLDERVAIGLVHVGEMTSTEVAEFLGVDEDTVHSLLTGGLQRLVAGPPRSGA